MQPWLQKTLDLIHPARSVTQIRRSAEQQRAAEQAAAHLVLYHFRSCPYCLRVRRAIHGLNVPIRMRNIHEDEDAYRTLIAGGGRQTVPCLHIDGRGQNTWLYESADIIRYLKRRFAPDREAA